MLKTYSKKNKLTNNTENKLNKTFSKKKKINNKITNTNSIKNINIIYINK